MKNALPIKNELVAPCGMNCAICSKYLAYANSLNKAQCSGCRPSNKKCTYLFGKCSGINNSLKGNAASKFCFECDLYPCREIDRMDIRYRSNYKMSVKENLKAIKDDGIALFLNSQYKDHNCPNCGGLISVHNRKCFKCQEIKKLIDKTTK
ncbi:MAG: DUF3795 domain-containing protein [Desulfatitalea sp.]|nr:DUF3795 domain-containing protein [Desulfatitalea sp.]